MEVLSRVVMFFFILHCKTIRSETNRPLLKVKIGVIEQNVNSSSLDISQNHIVIDRGNTVQFMCEGEKDIEWIYSENKDNRKR